MGCQLSHFKNDQFREKYSIFQQDFKKDLPLFDVQKIQFPLSTSKMKIVDKIGRRVKLVGTNWSGCHAQRHCISGLQYRTIKDICIQLKNKFKFNCIRLTFSLEMFYSNNLINQDLIKANKELYGKTSMEIFDYTIKTMTQCGLMVILNNHTSKSMWCCTPWDGDGLWYTKQYSEQKFFQCLNAMAERYKNNQRVIGMDLRNQVRSNYLTAPTWGSGNKQTDWKLAAQKASNNIHAIAPNWLIFVGSIDSQLDFTDIYKYPLRLKISNKLVYTGHFYGFSWLTTIWKYVSYEQFQERLFNRELYVRGLQDGIPFLLGQFGTNKQNIPWKYLMRLMKEYDLDWTYWCLDGYKCKQKKDQTYGIYSYYFDKIRHPEIFKDLQQIGFRQE